jgi:hypothetical protein
VPADRIVGKSPDYVSAYTVCYEQAAKKKITGAACGGWAAGSAIAIAISVAAASASDASSVSD